MSGLSLADLQRQFLARLQGQPAEALATEIAACRMPSDVGLNIYVHAYNARLREALEHDHPALGIYLGDSLWDTLCSGYIAACPSRQRSLRDFGTALPDYLALAEACRPHPEIVELALFERRLLDSFDAADAERADWEQLLARPESAWPGLRLHFHPSLMLHQATRNSVEIWRAIKDGLAPPPVRVATNTDWALWRDADRISRFRSLEPAEGVAVIHARQGGNFADLCELLLAWHAADAVPMVALGYLRRWCDEGWIARWD